MAADKTSWGLLAPEIRLVILEELTHEKYYARYATVCREWQEFIERKNFSTLRLTLSRIAGLREMIHRQRGLVRYITLCTQLQDYDCSQCEDMETETWHDSNIDIISRAIQKLFLILSKWDPSGGLVLDISVNSPSDSKHHFKCLDTGFDAVLDSDGTQEKGKMHDLRHGWVHGEQVSLPSVKCISRLFGDIQMKPEFWEGLPEVTVVTGLVLRRQTRRRWEPRTIAELLILLPKLQEIHYEPWREWTRMDQRWTDESTMWLFKSLIPNQLKRVVLFEDFNDEYMAIFQGVHRALDAEPVRIADGAVGTALAEASLDLEHLSASFIVDARDFFEAIHSTWVWSKLLSLVLTSRLLVPGGSLTKISSMLQAAAAAVMKMPRLNTMELWNCGKRMACVFRFQAYLGHSSAAITWRGNWNLMLEPHVIQSWQAVAARCGQHELQVVKETLDSDSVIHSHGDAIQSLKLLHQVIHPLSLCQIRKEFSHQITA